MISPRGTGRNNGAGGELMRARGKVGTSGHKPQHRRGHGAQSAEPLPEAPNPRRESHRHRSQLDNGCCGFAASVWPVDAAVVTGTANLLDTIVRKRAHARTRQAVIEDSAQRPVLPVSARPTVHLSKRVHPAHIHHDVCG